MTQRRTWLWMIVLLLLAFALGVRMLQADILWFDEAKTVFFNGARHFGPLSPAQVWNNLAANDPWQSPGYYLLLDLWAEGVGWSDFAARSLSLFIGMIALAWLYRLARDMLTARIGIYAAAVMVGSSLYIHYLHEMRPYALYLVMTCLSVWAYWRILNINDVPDKPKRTTGFTINRNWMYYIALFIGLAGLAYTHVFALLTAFGIGAYHLLIAPKNKRWLLTSAVMLLASIAFLPWLGNILKVIGLAADDARRQEVALFGVEILDGLLRAFGNGSVAIVLLMLGIGIWDSRRPIRLVTIWLVVAVGVAMLVSYIVPAFIHVRYLFSVWPALALLMAVGIDKAAQKGFPVVAILAVWLIIGVTTSLNTGFFESLPNSRYNIPREGFMQMVATLEEQTRPQDMVVLHTSPPFEEWDSDDIHAYYFPNIAADYTHMELIRPIAFEANEATYMQAVDEVLSEKQIVWTAIVPDVPFTRRRSSFLQQLNSTHLLCQQVINRPDMNLYLYARPTQNVIASFADGAVQVQALWDIPQTSDPNLDVLFGIERSPDLPPDTYSVSIQLFNADNQFVTNVDYGLANAAYSCRWSTLENLPPGTYQLAIVVYAWQTGERMASDSDDADERFMVGEVRIE